MLVSFPDARLVRGARGNRELASDNRVVRIRKLSCECQATVREVDLCLLTLTVSAPDRSSAAVRTTLTESGYRQQLDQRRSLAHRINTYMLARARAYASYL